MKIITCGNKLPRATAFSGDEEVQEYIEQALADDGVWYEIQINKGADVIDLLEHWVNDTSSTTLYVWLHPDRENLICSESTPQEIIKKMNDVVDEAEEHVAEWKSKRDG